MAEFTFKEYSIRFLNHEPIGLMGNKWTYKDPKQFLKGRGDKAYGLLPAGGGEGEGTLKIWQSEYMAIVKAIKTANPLLKITDVSFDISESFGNGATAISNRILGVMFEEFNGGLESGNANLVIELKYKFTDVQEGI